MIYRLFCFMIFLFSLDTFAQQSLSYQMFMKMVLDNHPVAKQAQYFSDLGKMEVRLGRGTLDPKFELDYTTKVYDGKEYYGYLDNGLKIPLWFGADIKAGYENNTGINKNPSDNTPDGGLEYLGMRIPIGQGMVIDERRAAIKQAYAMQNSLEAEKIKMVNKILFSAAKEYWNWYLSFNKYQLQKNFYKTAQIRFNGIVERAKQGDLASIDSVEAYMNIQEREINYQNAKNEFLNSQLSLSNYLWTKDLQPLELDTNLLPENQTPKSVITQVEFQAMLDKLNLTNPDLLKLNAKITHLDISRKLETDNLKPNLDFTLKYLTSPQNQILENLNLDYWRTHYKVQLTYSQPIFLRKERAKYQMSKIKLEQTKLEKMFVEREILNMTKAKYNEYQNLYNVFDNQTVLLKNYQVMLDGEKQKFETGESSVFMVNSREMKLLEGQTKYFETRTKLEKSKLDLLNSIGNLESQVE